MLDLIIIGAGPAGISAAIYAKSRGLNLLVLEKNQVGGIVGNVSTVTHYSGIIANETGESFRNRLKEQALNSDVEIKYETVEKVELSQKVKHIITHKGEYEARAVILANGSTPRSLQIPGEAELKGKGMCMNAAKSAKDYENKNVYVVGGADGAIKEAIYLAGFAKKVTIIHFEDQLGCIDEFKKKLSKLSNVELMLHSRLVQVYGQDHVVSFDVKDEKDHSIKHIEDDGCGIFVYAGLVPNSKLTSEVNVTADGFIIVDEKMQTNIPGVFAVGDIIKKQVRQVATAVNDGAIAAVNAGTYLKNN